MQNIRIVREYATDLPLINGDPHRLQEVFLNLLTNAEQAMFETNGHGTLTVRTSLRTEHAVPLPPGQPPALDVPAPAVRIEFEDDGPGIPPDVLAHIFDPFYTTREVGQGTGLGLSICYGVVGEHYGRIWAESGGEGQGTRFIIELPVSHRRKVQASTTESARQSPGDMIGTGVAVGKRVLVVDDEELVASLIGRMLERIGCNVTMACSGEEALARLHGSDFDVVVTDLKMPGISGQELYSRMQQERPELAKRFIFVTGDVITPGTGDFIRQSGRPSLSKPFTSTEMAAVLEEMLAGLENGDAARGDAKGG